MEKAKPRGVRRDNTGPVKTPRFDRDNDEEPNLRSDEGEKGEKSVSCRVLPFGACCHKDNELFDSANNNQAEGSTGLAIYSGNDHSPYSTFTQKTNSWNITCVAGGEQGRTVEGSSGDGDGNGVGDDASTEEKRRANKPKKRAVRAAWYSYQFRGTMYHIKMDSSLGRTYQSLGTKAEQRDFMTENGEAEPCLCGSRLRAAR